MLGDFITRVLVMFLGYAYPAFECFKIVEKNRVEIEQLRFWCQYWIIVALLTVFERFGEIFISWLPMYGEMKLAFVIYLWYPKTKGTSYVYETFLQPCVAKHETSIDRKLLELRARAWDLAILYCQNSANYGQTTFFQIVQYLAAQSSKARNTGTQKVDPKYANAPPSPSAKASSFSRQANKQTQQAKQKWPPTTPPAPPPPLSQSTIYRDMSQPPESILIQHPQSCETQSEAIVVGGGGAAITHSDSSSPNSSDDIQDIDMNETLQAARIRLRLSQSRPQP